MPIKRNTVDVSKFNKEAQLPYELRRQDFQIAMQDVYDFFYDVNSSVASFGIDARAKAKNSGSFSTPMLA